MTRTDVSRRRMAIAALLGGALCAAGAAAQQAPPGPDIFVAALEEANGRLTIGAPRNVTTRAGYDNQPAFTPNGAALLYTSIRADAQADIWRVDLAGGASSRVTTTPESEYSPTPVPGGGFSAVRVERDSTQRLWRFAMDGSDAALVLPDVKPVGYHAWGDERTLLLFVLGDPATLVRADARTGAVTPVVEHPGRSLVPIPGQRAVSFVRKRKGGDDWVMRYDLDAGTFTPLVAVRPRSEDHAWTPGGTLLMAEGSRLYAWRSGGEWREVAAFGDPAMARITRIAVSPRGDRIALVGEPVAAR